MNLGVNRLDILIVQGKKAVVFEGSLILVTPILGLHIELDQLKDEATQISQGWQHRSLLNTMNYEPGCDLTEYPDCAGMLCYPHLWALVQLMVLHSQ